MNALAADAADAEHVTAAEFCAHAMAVLDSSSTSLARVSSHGRGGLSYFAYALLFVLYAVVGPQAFFKALSAYMHSFRYGNATTDDLWGCMEDASAQAVRRIAGDWTRQVGFPLLTVTAFTPRSDGTAIVSLEQDRFLADGSAAAPAERKLWTVPLFVATAATADAASRGGGAKS